MFGKSGSEICPRGKTSWKSTIFQYCSETDCPDNQITNIITKERGKNGISKGKIIAGCRLQEK